MGSTERESAVGMVSEVFLCQSFYVRFMFVSVT